ARIDFGGRVDRTKVALSDFAVARIRAEASAKLGNNKEAALGFQWLAELYLAGKLPESVKSIDVLGKLVKIGIDSAQLVEKTSPESIRLLAGLYATKGRLLYEKQFDNSIPGAKKQLAAEAYAAASACYPPGTKDAFLAECRMWEGYLADWSSITELQRFAQ